MREGINKSNFKNFLLSELLIILGSAFFAAGFQFFMYPNDITTGGITGIAMILNHLLGLP
ncbi:MAG: YitT family protein, partial [Oscillospiraceae bacterium]|nr:YitT family protein [Oscillospiraceae bacterium]